MMLRPCISQQIKKKNNINDLISYLSAESQIMKSLETDLVISLVNVEQIMMLNSSKYDKKLLYKNNQE